MFHVKKMGGKKKKGEASTFLATDWKSDNKVLYSNAFPLYLLVAVIVFEKSRLKAFQEIYFQAVIF